MTRARKIDPAILEREYIFDATNPPISISDLAARHGLARSGVADKARIGRWYERRVEFRQQMGEKVVEALGDKWAEFETAVRERLMQSGLTYLDAYDQALKDGDIKVNTRDMLGIAAMLRTLIGDAALATGPDHTTIDPENVTLPAEDYRQAVETIQKLLAAGEVSDDRSGSEQGSSPGDASTGEERTVQD